MREYKPLSDDRFYDQFDCNIINHSFNLREIIEDLLECKDLENLHEKILPTDVQKYFRLFLKIDYNIIDEYIDSIVKPIIGDTEYLVQRTPNFRIVLPNHDSHGQVLLWHQGIWAGNGYSMRTIWTPITNAYDTNTMHNASQADSLEFTKNAHNEKWDYDRISTEAIKICKPANLNYGQTLLFTQENLHGQVPNRTNKTRISFEYRILLKDGDFFHKTPGGYFRKPFNNITVKNKEYKNAIIMPTFDGPMFYDSTQFAQTILMEQYVKKYNIEVNFKCIDLITTNCTYAKWLAKNSIFDNMVFPSIWAFQVNDLKELLEHNITMHFASEDLCCDNEESKALALYYRTFTNKY